MVRYGDNSNIGATWIFTFNSSISGYSQMGSKLIGMNCTRSWQGNAVSIASNINTIVVGGYYDDNYVGSTWIFTLSTTHCPFPSSTIAIDYSSSMPRHS